MIKERNLDWFPRMRAMSLAADDAETEQNEMRAMQLQLDQTQKLLLQVTQQLSDVKEQVCNATLANLSLAFIHAICVFHNFVRNTCVVRRGRRQGHQ